MQVPTASPRILIEITEALNHFKSQLKIICPRMVEISAIPKKAFQVLMEYPVHDDTTCME